jgi:hypothetical protein
VIISMLTGSSVKHYQCIDYQFLGDFPRWREEHYRSRRASATTAREAWRQCARSRRTGRQRRQRQRLSDAPIFSASTLQRENSSRRTRGKDKISRR